MKEFEMVHLHWPHNPKVFTEDTALCWLRYGGPVGSTMDNRRFWNDHVMKLKVGESISTDFQRITRIK